MKIDASNSQLENINVELIDRNPDNPRIFFRQEELDVLQQSIREHGIQVPISVFRRGRHYILIDGERRWRCALKLNLKTIPALVQKEPDKLTNVLLMFNIHALREQWDLLTIALKLPMVIGLLTAELERLPTEAEIAAKTGLNRSLVRRCKLLMGLPESYREQLVQELRKPKSQQKLTEDFFIEMERALKTVERSMPEAIKDKNQARDVLIKKYRSDIIKDLTDLRYLPKIAKASRVQADTSKARKALIRVFESNEYSVEVAFENTVAEAYNERDLATRIAGLSERLEFVETDKIDDDVIEALRELRRAIDKILRAH